MLNLIKQTQENKVVNFLLLPLLPRCQRHITESTVASEIVDWITVYEMLEFTTGIEEGLPVIREDNCLAMLRRGESLTDRIMYTTYKPGWYLYLNTLPTLHPSTYEPLMKKRYIDVITTDPQIAAEIDDTQQLALACHLPVFCLCNLWEMLFNDGLGDCGDFAFYDKDPSPSITRKEWDMGLDWKVEPSRFQPKALNGAKPTKKSQEVVIVPQVCCLYPVRYSLYRTLTMLASVTNYMLHVHKVTEFSQSIEKTLTLSLPYDYISQAFTAKDVGKVNYDILETYGDSWVKYDWCGVVI